jgi:L-threonylcarbamoyladenylate synthase
MKTHVFTIRPSAMDKEALKEAADILRAGGLVAFPTETVYGLGANAFDEEAVKKIYEVKGRPSKNPLIVHVKDIEQAKELVSEWPKEAEMLTTEFWPGALTLILPKSDKVPLIVTGGGNTVAIRMPCHMVALGLLEEAGFPIAAPSANPSEYLSPTTAEHVLRMLDGKIDAVIDGRPTTDGLESTVIDLTVSPPRILRPGPILAEELEYVLGVAPESIAHDNPEEEKALKSPGMMKRHYAPRAKLIVERDAMDLARENAEKEKTGLLCISEPEDVPKSVAIIHMPETAGGYGTALYSALHEMEKQDVKTVFIECPPETRDWEAVWDRLIRASHPPSHSA